MRVRLLVGRLEIGFIAAIALMLSGAVVAIPRIQDDSKPAVGVAADTAAPAKAKKDTKKQDQSGVIAEGTLPDDWVKTLHWRCVGPSGQGGRITSISVFEADPNVYWIGTGAGGVLKTTNNGTTFEHQFDHE